MSLDGESSEGSRYNFEEDQDRVPVLMDAAVWKLGNVRKGGVHIDSRYSSTPNRTVTVKISRLHIYLRKKELLK